MEAAAADVPTTMVQMARTTPADVTTEADVTEAVAVVISWG